MRIAPAREAGGRLGAATAAVVALGLAAVAAMVRSQTDSATGLLDLRIYVGAAQSLRSGGSIYDFTDATFGLGSTYPPLWSLVVWPVAGLDIHALEYGWTMFNATLWLVTLRLVATPAVPLRSVLRRRGWCDRRALSVGVVWLLSLGSAPVWNTLNQGQVNIVLWFLLVVDLRLLARSHRWAGALTGIAAAVKLVPAVFLVAYALCRRWRAAAIGAGAALAATAAAAVLAPADSRRFWTVLLFETGRVGDIGDAQNNSLAALGSRLGLADGPAVLAGMAVGGALLLAALPAVRRTIAAGDVLVAAVLVGCALALASPVSWTHHLVFLCFALLGPTDPDRMPRRAARWRWPAVVAGAVLLADPGGFGRSGATSSARTLVMVAVLAGVPRLRILTAPTAPDPTSDPTPARGSVDARP